MFDNSYENWNAMSDKALAEHIGHFVKEKCMELNKTQDTLANAAGISRSTLSLLEKGQPVTLSTLLQVLRVLDQLHLLDVLDVFTLQPTFSPIQLDKIEQKKRKRASGSQVSSSENSSW